MGAVFALFAGFYYWLGKITGYQYPETLGKIHFYIMFIGVFKDMLAPINLAWCWNIYNKDLLYMVSNSLDIKGKQGSDIKNSKLKKDGKPSDRQSAGVCEGKTLTASQRINAKDLWYILGLIEGDGSFSCYLEGQYVRAEMALALEEADAKLVYWVKDQFGYGSVKFNSFSKTALAVQTEKSKSNPRVARFIIRSKFKLIELLDCYNKFPPLTKNKSKYIAWTKMCINKNSLVSKEEFWNFKGYNSLNLNQEYVKDWIVGFIEAEGSFYITASGLVSFNLSQMNEETLLTGIGQVMGLSGKNKVSIKANGQCILTAVSLNDIQAVLTFMCHPNRVRLKGLKKVKFLLWLSELRRSTRYLELNIPIKY